MILLEFIISLYTITTLTASILLLVRDILQSPILETKLYLLTTITVWIAVFLSAFAAIFSTSTTVTQTSQILAQVEMSLIGPFYIFLTFSFMLPNFKMSYTHIFNLSIIVAVNSTLNFLLYTTTKLFLTRDSGFLRYTLPLISGLMFGVCTLIFLYYFFHRLFEVKALRENEETEFVSVKEMTVIIIIALFSVFTILTSFRFQDFANFLELELPGHIFLVPFSFIFMISAYLIHKDTAFPFVVPIKLYGIIITQKDTGLSILSKDYQKEIKAMQLLGNLFAALDISLQETIKSSKTIEDVVFGDKVVHIASGSLISAMMIVSKNSLITKTMTKYIAREFEKRYADDLDPNKALNINIFKGFEDVFKDVRKYLAL